MEEEDQKAQERGVSESRKAYKREFARKWRAKNPERSRATVRRSYAKFRNKRIAYARGYYADNREKMRKAGSEWQKNNLDKVRAGRLRREYGLTVSEYDAMALAQDNKCAVCGLNAEENPHGRLAVDHCHKVAKIRGLLCNICNRGLGLFGENQAVLKAAAAYLEKHNA